jgi:hypothetical protein
MELMTPEDLVGFGELRDKSPLFSHYSPLLWGFHHYSAMKLDDHRSDFFAMRSSPEHRSPFSMHREWKQTGISTGIFGV